MEFRKVLALRGPNIWASFPVLEAWLDLGDLDDYASDELPGFNDRLMGWLPTLVEHRCSVGTRGGFFERLRRGTYQGHVLEHVALELQSLAGTEVSFGRTRAASEDGIYKVVVEYEEEELGRAALEASLRLCLAAVHDKPFDVPAEVEALQALARRLCPAPGTAAILEAARKRKIPVVRLGPPGLLQLGQGARARRLLGVQTDRTGALAESIATDTTLSCELLSSAGVPVSTAPPNPGSLWRLLVVGGRVAAAIHSESGADAIDRLHPQIAAHAVEAAQIIGLDVAGVEVVADDPSRPLEDQAGGVIGLDPAPALASYQQSASGRSEPSIADALLTHLFPTPDDCRIPVAAITGVNGKTTTTRLLAHLVARSGRCVGMTCTEGIYVGGRLIESGDCSGPLSARTVLNHPKVEAAVCETARGGILRAGLGFDRCDVAIVTNIGEGDHLGLADVETPEQLARVKRTIVEVVSPTGAAILNAADPLVADMACHCPGSVVFFARDAAHPLIVRHRGEKGRAAFVRAGHLILAEGDQEIPLVPLDCVPLTHGGRVGFQIENALAAAAGAWTLGIPCEVIRVGLETFVSDLDAAPARFNLLEVNGAVVVMDYGHNASSLLSLIDVLQQLPHRRRCAVYSAAGDRRDADLVRQGALLGDAFDRVLLYEEDSCARGRKPGEIFSLLREGLSAGRRVAEVVEIQGAVRAAEVALASVSPGEVLLVQVDQVEETIELVRRYLAEASAREIDLGSALARPVVSAAVS
jgi:cyanophycin synthetase